MKPAPFEYHAPDSAKEAVDLLAELGDGAKVIAGGQSLVPVLAMRLAAFDHLIDIRRIEALRGIEERGDSVRIGAGTTEAEIGRSALIARRVPLLSRATPLIGHFQIRNRGTHRRVAGPRGRRRPSTRRWPWPWTPTVEALSPRGQRTIPAAEFFTGIWTTALEPDELLTGVSFPAAGAGAGLRDARSSPGARATSRWRARPSRSSSTAGGRVSRSGIGLFGLGPTAAARRRRRGGRARHRRQRDRSGGDRAGRRRGPRLGPVRPARHRRLPEEGRARPWSTRAWEKAVREAASG